MNSSIAGRIALVTGATRGLGRELAIGLAKAGADVVIVGRDTAAGEITAQAIRGCGRAALLATADVSCQDDVDHVTRLAYERFGRIDILVCAAGVGLPRRPLWEHDAAAYKTCFDVNVLGVMLAMRAALPGMIAQRSGRIIAIGGSYGYKGVANFALYAASKWALRGLVKSTALETGPHGITVNVISPGGVEGERLRRQFENMAARDGESVDTVEERFVSSSALHRLVTADDIAAALLHLAGDGGRNITGQDIIVDAGTII